MFKFFKKKPKIEPEEKILFHIEKPEIPDLPEIKDKARFDLRYPLIMPYAYAHISWDSKNNELIYSLEEPVLDDEEKRILAKLEEGVRELINISFIDIKDVNVAIEYLEKNIKVLLTELRIKVTEESFLKLMYYIYRDFIGLNEVEPLLNDYFIEDIECNGINTPVYIVHRKYGNLKTNITYPTTKELTNFVEKLAQRCGKYISYASPLLDGTLPDGSRCNATYTQDISSRGPTFTLRKFTREPWSPVMLMKFKTISPELLAYLWLLIEHESNIMVIGGAAAGKTTLLNALAFFIPPQARIVSIEDSVSGEAEILVKKGDKIENMPISEFIKHNRQKTDAEVLTLDKDYNLKFVKPRLLLKHKTSKDIYEILTRSGRSIKVTEDHSIFCLGDKELREIKPLDLVENKSFIAVPRKIPFVGKEIKKINLINHLGVFKNDFFVGKPVQKIFKKYKFRDFGVSKSKYQWWKRNNLIKIKDFLKINFEFSENDKKELYIKSKNTTRLPVIFEINDEFLEFVGLWLGDGSYDRYNKNRVIVSNSDKECRKLVRNVAEKLNLNISKMNDKGVSLTINSTVFYKFLREVIGLKGKSATKKIPVFIQNLNNNQIKKIIKGYFSADGCVKKYEVTCASQSLGLLRDLQTLFLRLSILSRITDFNRKDKCTQLSVSSYDNINKFKEIGFLQKRKNERLSKICLNKSHHTNTDIIPLSKTQLEIINKYHKLCWPYLQGMQNIGREYLQKIAGQGSMLNALSHSDIFWDKVKKIRKLNKKERYVYDISIPGTEKFVCSNILLHNTREINLLHENWLPSVTRTGIGMGAEGKRGEIDLYTLLRESFRQRPDYVVVGEIRGKEAYVLFQGMASIPGYEKIVVLNDNHLKKIPIKILKGKDLRNYKVVTVNPRTEKIELSSIKSFMEHRPRKILYKIKTVSGKEVVTTGDHSVFTYTNQIKPVEVRYLKKDDFIISANIKKRITDSEIIRDKIKSIDKIRLKKAKPVYDISVQGTQNFIGGFGGVLLHNSGHPSFGTMHAEDIKTMIRRLETPPINLPSSLVESLDVVCVMTQTKIKDKMVRRIREVVEIIEIKGVEGITVNIPFVWKPSDDTFYFKTDSKIFDKLVMRSGITKKQLNKEFKIRSKLLMKLYKNNITGFKEVQDIINAYYKTPEKILKILNITV